MSKPISFGFSSKSKTASDSATPSASKPSAVKPISLREASAAGGRFFGTNTSKSKPPTLRDDSGDEDDAPPKHEELTGFSSAGAILSKEKQEERERVVQNAGNGDWRRRGKNILPAEVQAAKKGEDVTIVEKDEVSKAYGLQFAKKEDSAQAVGTSNGDVPMANGDAEPQAQKQMTEDERALAALLSDGTGPKSTATIAVQANDAWQRSEADDFRADVSSRPDSSTLEDYDSMPVEEFGMAMLRGMGRKRRANGEVIDFNKGAEEKNDKKKNERVQQGFLGIGAKPVKGLEGVELGAWGKSDMRKNQRGEGLFTPVMIEDTRTGERITEAELERRKKAAGKSGSAGEEDWRDRRDRNLEKSGRDRDGQRNRPDSEDGHTNGSSRNRDRDERDRRDDDEHDSSPRSRRDRDRASDRDRNRDGDRDRDYDSSRSRRERSRSRDRRKDSARRHYDDDRDRNRKRERHRDRHADGDRYESSSSRRDERRYHERDRDRGDRNGDRGGDDRRYRDRRD